MKTVQLLLLANNDWPVHKLSKQPYKTVLVIALMFRRHHRFALSHIPIDFCLFGSHK